MLRKYKDGMECRHTEQSLSLKVEKGKGKVNVEEKATQRGESANLTWSVERDGTRRCPKQRFEWRFDVKNFSAESRRGAKGYAG